jgi:hypothetical protein
LDNATAHKKNASAHLDNASAHKKNAPAYLDNASAYKKNALTRLEKASAYKKNTSAHNKNSICRLFQFCSEKLQKSDTPETFKFSFL